MWAPREINVLFVGTTSVRVERRYNPLPPPASGHAIIAILVPAILDFLELDYQGKNVSPFEIHPMPMWVAVAGLFLYCLAYEVERRCPAAYAWVVRRAAVVCGSLAGVCLASVLFPGLGRLALFLVYALFLASQVPSRWVRMMRNWLLQRMIGWFSIPMNQGWRNEGRLMVPRTTNRAALLPL